MAAKIGPVLDRVFSSGNSHLGSPKHFQYFLVQLDLLTPKNNRKIKTRYKQ